MDFVSESAGEAKNKEKEIEIVKEKGREKKIEREKEKEIEKEIEKKKQEEEDSEEEGGCLFNLFVDEEYTEQTYEFSNCEQKLLCSMNACTAHDLTGQIVWPASVLLGWFVDVHGQEYFSDQVIIELGAGCGLGGFVAAQYGRHVIITDGNEIVVRLLKRNEEHLNATNVTTAELYWGQQEAMDLLLQQKEIPSVPTVIIGADVILWPNQIAPLLCTIYWLLQRGGRDVNEEKDANSKESVCYISYVVRAYSTTDKLKEYSKIIGLDLQTILTDSFLSPEIISKLGNQEKYIFKFTLGKETMNPGFDGPVKLTESLALLGDPSYNPNYAQSLPC